MTDTPTNSPRRLALCFDGTWNSYESNTNVSRIFEAIADRHTRCDEQLKFYDEGVGTNWGTKVLGGAFGVGLSRNVLEGYCWLINTYRPGELNADDGGTEPFSMGDELYLFGFSRGAYTARSLAGLINRCGIPKRELLDGQQATLVSDVVKKAWALYEKDFATDTGLEARQQIECVAFRKKHSHTVLIKFVGVWDTVGALGVPTFVTAGIPIGRFLYRFQIGRAHV